MDKEKREKLRERFLRNPLPQRLSGLAATLASISSSARNSTEPAAIINLLEEASLFVEWITADTEPAITAELVQIQRIITMWQKSWNTARRLPQQRTLLAAQTKNWSDKVAGFSKSV